MEGLSQGYVTPNRGKVETQIFKIASVCKIIIKSKDVIRYETLRLVFFAFLKPEGENTHLSLREIKSLGCFLDRNPLLKFINCLKNG